MTPSDRERGETVMNRILKLVPGFSGYLEEEKRRESDEKARAWIVKRLQKCKAAVDAHTGVLAGEGKLDQLPNWEKLRTKLDTLITRIKSNVQSYAATFAAGRLDKDVLEDVYDFDADLLDLVAVVAGRFEQLQLPSSQDVTFPALLNLVADVQQRVDKRDDLLSGLR